MVRSSNNETAAGVTWKMQVSVSDPNGTVLWSEQYEDCEYVSDALEQALLDAPAAGRTPAEMSRNEDGPDS